mmetsp:Transcript_13186/g.11268  ORF Transcript_13186/g.11268 Transcript_13186/m.11268 type:complete len:324 (+) Transcript_13186:505-1476(+)
MASGWHEDRLSLDKGIVESGEKLSTDNFICHYLLGQGSFGEVYLVEKVDNKKLYAMKVLRKNNIRSDKILRYTLNERTIMGMFDHPFIMKLHSAFQTDENLYLVMDYISGGDLGGIIAKKVRLNENIARIYAAEVILAIEALHEKNIVYRDLKPENLLVDKDGHLVLTDFGLAKKLKRDELTDSFCGSVAYLAPEVVRRSGHNHMVDWYTVGVLIYEMLVGLPPYFSKNRDEFLYNIANERYKLPKNISEDGQSLLKGLLKKSPKKRLGAEKGAEEIKSHPWFKNINWKDAYDKKLKTPSGEKIIPKLDSLINAKLGDVTPAK